MRRAKFDDRAENGGASGAQSDGADLMCRAYGCPNRWSWATTGEARGLCSAHQTGSDWPAITARVLAGWHPYREKTGEDAEAMRLAPAKAAEEVSRMRGGNPQLSGAWMLRKCELECGMTLPDGRRMTQAQRDFWRVALKPVLHAIDE